MFKGFSCDSITVPSCDNHNSRKSGDDQAIVSALLIALRNGAEKYPLEPDIRFAIEQATPSFERAKRKAKDSPLLSNPPEYLVDLPNVAYISPIANIRAWVRQLTAALVYDAIKTRHSEIKWDDAIAWSPHFVESDEPIPLDLGHVMSQLARKMETEVQLKELHWLSGWSARPTPYPSIIYSFDLHFAPEHLIFRHRFYNRYTWYVWLSAAPSVLPELIQKISTMTSGKGG